MPPALSPVSLYVHVPFRSAPRPYDDAAYEVISPEARRQYLSALETEAQAYAAPRLSNRAVDSIYVGGGRPSLLSLSDLRRLFAALPASAVAEFTLEVSPADATPAYLDGLVDLGVHRICVEGLSFSSAVLQSLNAPVRADAVKQTIVEAQAAGIDSIALDLLFGMDGLSDETWGRTLRQAVSCPLAHLSLAEAPPLAPEAVVARQLEDALSLLNTAGYEHYSFTHFARPGHRSRHQVHYTQHGGFLGLGPAAASLWWSQASPPRAERWSNVETVAAYARRLHQGRSPASNHASLTAHDLGREYALLRLQTRDGLDLTTLREAYGLDLRAAAGSFLDRLRTEGLAHDAPDRVQLTPRGRMLTDAITRRLLSSL